MTLSEFRFSCITFKGGPSVGLVVVHMRKSVVSVFPSAGLKRNEEIARSVKCQTGDFPTALRASGDDD